MQFTVIGFFDDTGLTFAVAKNADDAYTAMQIVAAEYEYSPHAAIIGALPGRHELIAACEDSGNIAYAVDLRD
jgi:hypothetical protein